MKLHKELCRQRNENRLFAKGAKPKTHNHFKKKLKCYYNIIYKYFLNCHPINLEEVATFVEKNRSVFIKAYNQLLYKDHFRDKMVKVDSSEVCKNLDDMELHVSYISDRFFCYYHLAWLIDLPENYRKLKQNETTT